MDIDSNYSFKKIQLEPDYEGKVIAVLASSKANTGNRKSVLYIHGYVDYFFHPHVGEAFNQNGYDFYALDLRKHGRALLEHQHPNYCKDISEYYEEISHAIREIKDRSNSVFLLAHSTGGLITSAYMNNGKEKNLVDGMILNAPFFDFYQTSFEKFFTINVAKLIARFSDYASINGVLKPVYAQSIHKNFSGEWDFNLAWKPIQGFPTYFKWVAAIVRAQRGLRQSNISVPILIMHSSGSKRMSKYSAAATAHDVVLNIKDMLRIGEKLGDQVTFLKIDQAIHDIFLSRKEVRENAFAEMFKWMARLD